MRLDAGAPLPSPDKLRLISELQGELAMLQTANPPLEAEAVRQAEVLVELHDLGSRADAHWIKSVLRERGVARGPFNPELSQEQFDQWQTRQVQRRDGQA